MARTAVPLELGGSWARIESSVTVTEVAPVAFRWATARASRAFDRQPVSPCGDDPASPCGVTVSPCGVTVSPCGVSLSPDVVIAAPPGVTATPPGAVPIGCTAARRPFWPPFSATSVGPRRTVPVKFGAE